MIQEPISTEETWLQGIPVSPGIALGKIKIQISGSKEPVAYEISPEEVDAELVRCKPPRIRSGRCVSA